MFPVAAAAAAAGVTAARRQQELALRDLLRDPRPLWHGQEELLEPVWLVFLHIHSVDLVPKFANTRLQIRAKYGDSGRFQEKYSQKVRSSNPPEREQVRASFESMFLFSWSRELSPEIHLQLIKLGFIDWTISESGMRLPFGEGNPGAIEHDLLFMGKKGENGFVGQVSIFVEVKPISIAEIELGIDGLTLRALDLARTVPRGPSAFPGAYAAHHLSGGSPVVMGLPVPEGAGMAGPGVVQGEALDHGRHGARRPRPQQLQERLRMG